MSGLSRTNIRRVSPLREGQSRFESNISSVQNQDAYARARERTEGGLLTSARRQMLNGNQATPPPVAASTPPPVAASTPPAVPPLLARPRPVAPAREGRIDGMPASSALTGMRAEAAAGGPRQEYGGAIAEKNVAFMGVNGAIADYFNRNRLDAERPQRAAALTDPSAVKTASNPLDYSGPIGQARVENRSTPYQKPDMALSDAEASAKGAATLRTPALVSARMDYRTALRSPDAQQAMRGEVSRPVMDQPALARSSTPKKTNLLYSLGRTVRDSPGATVDAMKLAVGGVDSAGAAISETVGRVGLDSGRAIKRGAANFRAGFMRR